MEVAANRPHRPEYRLGTTVQQARRRRRRRRLPSTSLLSFSSCPAVAFLSCHLWLPAAVTCTGRHPH